MLVRKKNTKDKRVCIDRRALNSRIRHYYHSYPLIKHNIQTIGSSIAKC